MCSIYLGFMPLTYNAAQTPAVIGINPLLGGKIWIGVKVMAAYGVTMGQMNLWGKSIFVSGSLTRRVWTMEANAEKSVKKGQGQ